MTHLSPATRYANELVQKHHGYPLWDPDPQEEPAVEVADVGYVSRGKFIRLFNASKPLGDSSNKDGVPSPYHPLEIGAIDSRADLPSEVPIATGNVKLKGGESAILWTSALQVGGQVSFECSKKQGALLLLGDNAVQHEVVRRKRDFLDYTVKYHHTWLEFANQHGIVDPNELILVTGYAKTSAWACGVFKEELTSASLSVSAGVPYVSGGRISLWGSWRDCPSVDTHSGPRPRTTAPWFQTPRGGHMHVSGSVPSTVEGGELREDVLMGDVRALSPLPIRDQCVFLRGFKLCDRQTAIERIRRFGRKKTRVDDGFEYVSQKKKDKDDPDASGSSRRRDPVSNPSRGSGGSSSTHGEGSHGTKPSGAGAGSQSEEKSDPSGSSGTDNLDSGSIDYEVGDSEDSTLYIPLNSDKEPTPLDFVLDYIFEKSKAVVALVHDDDLVTLLHDVESITDFRSWLHEVAPQIFLNENQMGMLETTYRLSLSDSRAMRRVANFERKTSNKKLEESQDMDSDGSLTEESFKLGPVSLADVSVTRKQPGNNEGWLSGDEVPPKRPRGRPKGSKNKPQIGGEAGPSSSPAPETKRKRGRPPKEKPAGVVGEPGEEERPPKRPRGRPRRNPVPEPTKAGEGETSASARLNAPKKRGRPSKAT